MIALIRAVPASFARALASTRPAQPIDVARARVQHEAYARALVALGLELVRLPADEDCPDCPFVEDTAVVAGGRALLTRPGAPSRRAETPPVARALALRCAVASMDEPATLDGGDVLRVGGRLYVGASTRSNDAGAARLAEALGLPVVRVALPPGVLHLKSLCSALAEDLVLVAAGTLPPATFASARVLVVPAAEAHAANAVVHGGAALIAAGCPVTQALVEAAGLRTVTVDTSELRKADGALTCLSILV